VGLKWASCPDILRAANASAAARTLLGCYPAVQWQAHKLNRPCNRVVSQWQAAAPNTSKGCTAAVHTTDS